MSQPGQRRAVRHAVIGAEAGEVVTVFRSIKWVLRTRPIYHKRDETIRGHVFCGFLALMLLKELQAKMEARGWRLQWDRLKGDLDQLHRNLKEVLELPSNYPQILRAIQGQSRVRKLKRACKTLGCMRSRIA